MELVIAVIGSSIGATSVGMATLGATIGMTGAQLGWMAGSIVGTLLFSDVDQPSPAGITDLKVTGSSYGTTLPYVVGTTRMAGQIIWSSDKSTTRNSVTATSDELTPGLPVDDDRGNDRTDVGFSGETDRGGGSFSTRGDVGPEGQPG